MYFLRHFCSEKNELKVEGIVLNNMIYFNLHIANMIGRRLLQILLLSTQHPCYLHQVILLMSFD